MNKIMLSELAAAANGELLGAELLGADWAIQGYSTDTRRVSTGDLYFCLRGDNFDGHDFVNAAIDSGVCAVVCDQKIDSEIPQLLVSDTRRAFGLFARLWRAQFKKPVIGVTGSNGKTTVKQLLAAIFKQAGNTHVTHANHNNEVGVPQTLLGLTQAHAFAVIEMGASLLGDIEWLSELVQPDISLITNASAAHLEGLGDAASVAAEKAWIYKSLAPGGTAVINSDNAFYDYWLEICSGKKVITFGAAGDVVASRIGNNSISIAYDGQSVECEFNLAGDHNVANAAAASACAIAAGLSLDTIAVGLAEAAPVAGRLNMVPLADGITVIDDTYNANPASVRAAIDVLAEADGKRIVVLGALGELGPEEAQLHKAIGEYARAHKVDCLMAYGELTKHAVKAFGDNAKWYASKEQLSEALVNELDANTTVLVKGSRSMKMEDVVAYVCAQSGKSHAQAGACSS